jgi:hypothetical protein
MTTIPRACAVLLILGIATACAPRAATPSASDLAATVAAGALRIVQQTAAAASPTPSPTETATPLPPATPTPNFTSTPPHSNPLVTSFAGCYFGPGATYTLESNISQGKRVELLGVGSQAGWYIIRNPYVLRPCWIAASNLSIDPGVNTAALPVMTPGAPLPGQ